jgi:hypothetical protein
MELLAALVFVGAMTYISYQLEMIRNILKETDGEEL